MRLSIRVKLIGGFLIVVALLLAVFGIAYNGIASVSRGANDIKQAAALDDAVMSMDISLLNTMDIEAQALIIGYSPELDVQFQEAVAAFDEGEATITELGTTSQLTMLEEMVQDHENFQAAILTTMGLVQETNNQAALLSVNDNVAPLFGEANLVVQTLVNSNIAGAALDQAGAQRMRAYKMAFLANNYVIATGAEALALATELEATISQFEAVQAGLRNGDASLGLAGTTDAALLARLSSVDSTWASFEGDLQEVLAVGGNQGAAIANALAETDPIITELQGNLVELEGEIETFGAAALAGAESAKNSATLMTIVIALIAAVVAIALGFYLSQGISKGVGVMLTAANGIAEGDINQDVQVKSKDEIGDMAVAFSGMIGYMQEMAGAAGQIADGDLTIDVEPKSEKDALGNAFSRMIASLRGLIGQATDAANNLGEASTQLSSASEQAGQATQGIASTSQQVAKGAEEQSQSIQATTSSVEQLAKAIDQIAQGAQEQAKGTQQASGIVNQVSAASEQVATNAQAAA
ncbi:MAG: HAMP domain-containing protein, partial [Dehalococcoidia bacterium]